MVAVTIRLPSSSLEQIPQIDSNLIEVTIPRLQQFYAAHKYTVTQVVEWHIARIQNYNGIYRAVQNLEKSGAPAAVKQQDAAPNYGALQGIPIVRKANTSVSGMVTTDGWQGFEIPRYEFVAPQDVPIAAKPRAGGDKNRSTAYGRTGNAYDVRFSPGGSSRGTVTAVTFNYILLGNGTDTGNFIRMPATGTAIVFDDSILGDYFDFLAARIGTVPTFATA